MGAFYGEFLVGRGALGGTKRVRGLLFNLLFSNIKRNKVSYGQIWTNKLISDLRFVLKF